MSIRLRAVPTGQDLQRFRIDKVISVYASELDGSEGNNRSRNGTAQIAARNDLDALRAWLARFADTKTTFDNYRKEAERLLLWSVLQTGQTALLAHARGPARLPALSRRSPARRAVDR